MRILVCSLIIAAPLFAQNFGAPVAQVDFGPPDAVVHQLFYDGSSNLIYDCFAPQSVTVPPNNVSGNPGYFSIALANLTNITVSGGTGTINFSSTSFLWVGAQVAISGSATTALNTATTTKILTVSGSTATFTTTAANGTYTDAGLVVSTLQPLLNQAIWTIKVQTFASMLKTGTYWAAGISQGVGRLACSNRTNF